MQNYHYYTCTCAYYHNPTLGCICCGVRVLSGGMRVQRRPASESDRLGHWTSQEAIE